MSDIRVLLMRHAVQFAPVVPFDPQADRLFAFNLTAANTDLSAELVADTDAFSAYVDQQRGLRKARYAIGGYGEHRTLYSRSEVFDAGEEPRRFHLGLDIWGDAGTEIHAPLDAIVHSFAFNDHFGDYGATIILQHELEGLVFHSLYGHLSLANLDLVKGQRIAKGASFAHFGIPRENGWWPPHLHMQLIMDMEGKEGDYPGVCRYSERERYLLNCPDPDLVCQLFKYSAND